MKIAFDARAYEWTGIGRYIRNLLMQFKKQASAHSFIVIAAEGQAEKIQRELQLPDSQFSFVEVSPEYYSWQEQVVLPRQLRSVEADIFHFTHFNVPVRFNRPYVVTIHDATRFIFPGQRRQRWFEQMAYEYVFVQSLVRARGAIFVSGYTKEEIERLALPLPPHSAVIPEGVDDQFLQPVSLAEVVALRQKYHLTEQYMLYVGVWMAHKNIKRMLEAFGRVLQVYPDVQLVITGEERVGYSPVKEWCRELGLEGKVVFPGFVSRKELPAFYAGAQQFIFPSLYEGFGLPPLEAAGCGIPVVASNISSIPEVMGQAAKYVNPEDIDDLARGMIQVLRDLGYRQKLIAAGEAQAKVFQWETCARATLDLLERV